MSGSLPLEITQHYPLPISSLPAGWGRVWLSDIAVSINPGFASGKHTSDGIGVPHLRPMNVDRDGRIDLSVVKSVASAAGTTLAAGDVLFNNTNSPDLVGKTALVSARESGYAFSNHMTRIRLEPEFESAFVARQLHYLWMSGYLKTRCTNHVNQASISSTTLAATVPVLLAPAAEQQRIVETLDVVLSDLDAGVAELKAAQKKLTRYRQSLLKSAVEGSLTAEWRALRKSRRRARETAPELLERILRDRRTRWEAKQLARYKEKGESPPKDWRSKYHPPPVQAASGLPELPEGWLWTSIGQCFHVAVGATPSRKEPSYWNGSIPWVSSGEVRFSHITETREQISELGLENSSTAINPAGSVMLGMIGEGKTRGQVAILGIEAANNQNCAAIWVSETEVPAEYVYSWLWSRYEDTRRDSSGNNQPALNKSIVERIPFPLAPPTELRVIVDLLAASLSQIEAQEAAIALGLKQAGAQRKNLLATAFSGRLIPQSAEDEPAGALLQRIRAKRAAEEKQPHTRKTRAAKEVAAMVKKLIDVLSAAADWLPAQEAFRRCGVADGAQTDQIEALYAELRALDQSKRLAVEAVNDAKGRKLYDRLKLVPAV